MPAVLRNSLVDQLTTKTLDFHQRRITNAADAVGAQDYVTLSQLQEVGNVMFGFFANKPKVVPGVLYYAIDRSSLYIGSKKDWVYVSGIMRELLSKLPAGLGLPDTGFTFEAVDYQHRLLWNGKAYQFVPGDASRYFQLALDGPPSGGVWGLCDGTAYSVLLADGSLEIITSPNIAAGTFLRAGPSYTGTPAAAARATWESAAKTAIENTKHTHSVNLGGSPSYAAGANTASSGGIVNTGSDSVDHYHTLDDTNSQLKVFSDTGGGMPLRFDVKMYLRR